MVRSFGIGKALDHTSIYDILEANFKVTGGIEIDDKGLVTVHGDCSLVRQVESLPVNFKEVTGEFSCSMNRLTSLRGAPSLVGGSFSCSHNSLTSLEGSPQNVKSSFYCVYNKLTSLQGGPATVGSSYLCSNNNLTSLKGAPQLIDGAFFCQSNTLKSLEGGPKYVRSFIDCRFNNLTSLNGLPSSCPAIYIHWNASLPLLKLVGRRVSFDSGASFAALAVEVIINKYVDQGTRANIVACQKELISAGYEGNASW